MPHCGLPTISTRPSAQQRCRVPAALVVQLWTRHERPVGAPDPGRAHVAVASCERAGRGGHLVDLTDRPPDDQHAAILQRCRGHALRPDRHRSRLECAGRRVPDLGPVDGRRGGPTHDQHAPVVEQRRRMRIPRLREAARRRERPRRGIPELRRRDRRAVRPHATGDEHPAVLEPRGGVEVSRGRERARRLPGRAGPLSVALGHDHRPGSVRRRGRCRRRLGLGAGRRPDRRRRHDGHGRREWAWLRGRGCPGQQGPAGRAGPQGDRGGQQRQAAEPAPPRPVEHRHLRDPEHRRAQRGRRRVLDPGVAEVRPEAALEIEVGVVHRVVPSRARPSMVSCRCRRA